MLAHLVLGRDNPAAFRPAIVAPLAGLLLLGATTALARVGRLGRLGRRIPGPLRQAGTLAITAGLAARGAAGLGMVAWGDPGTPFARLNRAVYTPACLALSVASLVAAWPLGRSGDPHQPFAAQRKPVLPDVLSGMFALRSAAR